MISLIFTKYIDFCDPVEVILALTTRSPIYRLIKGKTKTKRRLFEHHDSRLRNKVESTVNIYRALRVFAYFHINSINITPTLTTYVTTQIAVRARQTMFWEKIPASNIAKVKYEGPESTELWRNSPNMKQCRDNATKKMGVTNDNR